MAVLNDASVIDSFSELIPEASEEGEAYLRTLAKGIQRQAPPVELTVESVSAARSFGTRKLQCLVVTPTNRRHRHYKTLHYATPLGVNLQVGWYFIGRDRADGIGFMGIGAVNAHDVSEIQALVQLVHQFAVVPAMQQIAESMGYGASGQTRQGFFGA